MSFRDKNIKITDWAGNDLFIGDFDDSKVQAILDINDRENLEINWIDESDKDNCNVWEYV